jgi:hypothetical protein
MDYTSGTGFSKLEWDAIYAPGLVVKLLERDEDGLYISDNDKVQYLLLQLKCAYNSNSSYNDIHIPYDKKKISSNGRIEIDGTNGANITFEFPKLEICKISKSYRVTGNSLPNTKPNNLQKRYQISDDIILEVQVLNANDFEMVEDYINRGVYVNGIYEQLNGYISQNKKDDAINALSRIPYCVYEKLTYKDVYGLLDMLAAKATRIPLVGWEIPEKEEMKIINLLRTARKFSDTEKSNIVKAIGEHWFEIFDSGIDDAGGVKYHTEFLTLLLELCESVYSNDAINYKFNCSGNMYSEGITFPEAWLNSSYSFDEAGKFTLVTDSYNGSLQVKGSDGWEATDEGTSIKLYPTDPIYISNCLSSQNGNIVVPAYVLIYLIKANRTEQWTSIGGQLLNAAGFMVSVAGAITSAGTSEVVKGGALMAIASWVGAASSGLNLILSDESIKSKMTPEMKKLFEDFNKLIGIENAAQNFLDPTYKPNLLAIIPACITALNELNNVVNKATKENIEKMTESIEKLQKILKNENIIY